MTGTHHAKSVTFDSIPAAFGGGALIGSVGGLIGLGGAEFRLPLLISVFRFDALEAVILNKAISLVVVSSALPFRAFAVPWGEVAAHWSVIVNLLAGSLVGAWFGSRIYSAKAAASSGKTDAGDVFSSIDAA